MAEVYALPACAHQPQRLVVGGAPNSTGTDATTETVLVSAVGPVDGARRAPSDDGNAAGEARVLVSPFRWCILAMFSLLVCLQTAAWNTWGGIADTAKAVLNWTNADIALLPSWGPIMLVLTGFMFSYLLRVKGIRFCVLVSSSVLVLGLGIRCIPVDIENVRWTMNIGHVCIGAAGPVFTAAHSEVSAVWFPPHERTTSTAMASASSFIGLALSYLVGSKVVSSVPREASSANVSVDTTPYFQEIMNLMYIECGAASLVFGAAILFFRERPSTAPSVTATKSRESYKEGILSTIKAVNFWPLAAAFSLSGGVFSGWITQLDTIFQDTLNVGQDTVGYIGFCSNIFAMVGALTAARLVDLSCLRMKTVLLLFMVGVCLGSLWCVLLTMKYISFSLVSLYISCISIGVFVNAAAPIYYEISVECLYPVYEGSITMVLCVLNNAVALLFLMVHLIADVGGVWMNWVLMGCGLLCLPLVVLYRERYNRLNDDLHPDSK